MKTFLSLLLLLSSTAFADVTESQENQVSFNDSTGKAFTKIIQVTGQAPVVDHEGSETVSADAKVTCTQTRIGEHSCLLTIQK